MLILLFQLGCGGSTPASPKLAVPSCEPWAHRVQLSDERIVFCADHALTLRVDGRNADAQSQKWIAKLEKDGFEKELDVSRPRHFAHIYKKGEVRLTLGITETGKDTTISLRWKE